MNVKNKLFTNKTVLEINTLEIGEPIIGISIDYLIIKKELKQEFENNNPSIRGAIYPILKKDAKMFYI